MTILENVDPDLRLVIRGCQTKRFHAVEVITNETIGHHQGLIASLCAVTFSDMRPAFWNHIALHDLAEKVTGDVPSTAKRMAPELKEVLDRLEDKVFLDAQIRMPMLTDFEMAVFKLLDNAAGIVTCWYENQRGNRLILESFTRFSEYYVQCLDRPGWKSMLFHDGRVWKLNRLVRRLIFDIGVDVRFPKDWIEY